MAPKKKSSKQESAGKLLFEIGVEELPMHHWDNVENGEWEKICRNVFDDARIQFSNVHITTTPRRILFLFEGIPAAQEKSEKVFRGPALDKAYDSAGNPTQALEGFLRSKGISRDQLQEEKTEKGAYVVAKIEEPAKTTLKVLPEALKQLVTRLTFPKNMRWEQSGLRFSRPIRWFVALYEDKPVSFDLAGIKSGQTTRGHRFLASKPVRITNISGYEALMKKNHVIICRKERQELIRAELKKIAAKKGWDAERFDEELIQDASDLIEEPFLIAGSFDKKYLSLPSEVLSTCMKKHQKIFACYDKKGKLVPDFVAVLNGKRKDTGKISQDFGGVLESRLRDAQFFFHEDTQAPLARKTEKLKGIIFLGKLGTVWDKVERMTELARYLGRELNLNDTERRELEEAAGLSKTDLVTAMVYEFPELQGVMGREYALHDRVSKDVALAIDAQYWPKSLNIDYSDLRSKINKLGGILAIIEKIDTLVGAFGAGFIPTGSQDPYALRRAAGGIVKITRAFNFSFSLHRLIEKSRQLFSSTVKQFNPEAEAKLKQFFKDRLINELNLKSGTQEFEIFEAVCATNFDDLNDVLKRFDALKKFAASERQRFQQAAKVVERTSNILKGVKNSVRSEIKEDLFRESLEKELLKLYLENENKFLEQIAKKDYEGATRFYGQVFYDTIHKFFDSVMVNVDDPEVRANRQALMKKINSLYVDGVADLSCLTSVQV